MSVVKEQIDDLNAKVVITIAQEDYKGSFEEELKKYRQKAQIKGFRKGKTPTSFIKKVYGKQVLSEVVMNKLQEELNKFLTDSELKVLGQPMMDPDQKVYEYEPNELEDYAFNFTIGLVPEFELVDIADSDSFDFHKIKVESKLIDDEIANAQKRFGEMTHPTEGPVDEDVLAFKVAELEGDQVKEDGINASFSMLFNKIKPAAQDVIKKLKTGDEFNYDLYDLAEENDEAYVNKYFLGLEDGQEPGGNTYKITIDQLRRVVPAAIDEPLFAKMFGPDTEIKTEEEARTKMEEEIGKYYESQSDILLFKDVRVKLLADNNFDLPDEFLKSWLKTQKERSEQDNSEEGYKKFQEGLRWSLIQDKVSKKLEIKVEQEEIVNRMRTTIMSYFGNQPVDPQMIQATLERMMQNQDEVNRMYEQIMSEKVFASLKEKLFLNIKEISLDDFKALVEEESKD